MNSFSYLGQVTVLGLPKGEAGRIKCRVCLRMNHEGLLEVEANEMTTGASLNTLVDANPEHLTSEISSDLTLELELDPIEAERYKKLDYDFVYELERLDEYIEDLANKYRSNKFFIEKLLDTKEWLYKNRRKVTLGECDKMRRAIERYLRLVEK
jgi:molecular chaperone DnaK (HSP70)